MEHRISLGILAFSVEPEFIAMTQRAIDSYRGADEIIVVENGPYHEYSGVDTHVRFSENQFFTKSANTVLRIAAHDYVAIVNNDTYLQEGDVHDLCQQDTVMSPLITTQPEIGPFVGSFFVIPKTIIESIGYLDEQFKLYYSDTDYLTRLSFNGVHTIKNESVKVYHHIGTSTRHIDRDDLKEKFRTALADGGGDKEKYYKKYGLD
jgi:GT2 family glycosyltransferase